MGNTITIGAIIMKKLTDNQKIEVVQKYKTGNYTCKQLGLEYGVAGGSIAGILKRRGVVVNNNQPELQRKYTLNQNFFDSIDSEEKAYFLGILYADGSNYTPNNLVCLALQAEDKEILVRLNGLIESNRPLGYKKGRLEHHKDTVLLNINNKNISEKLVMLGCIRAKALILEFPTEDQVPSHLIRHFIRGYFDGDGCVGVYNNKRVKNSIAKDVMLTKIVSTEDVCIKIQEILFQRLNIKSSVSIPNKEQEFEKSTRQISTFTTVSSYKFLAWLYYDTDLYIQRKYDKFILGKKLIDDDIINDIDAEISNIIKKYE